ncbi:MAG: uroporphyrinogen decarboxylase family protein [Lachnospiraceae bacterium]
MHRDDEMTSNERLNAFFEGKEVDHLPAMPFLDSIGCKVAGMTHREKRRSPENTAKAQIACYERFGNDGMSIEYGLHGIGAACGSAMSDPENGAPAVVKHCLYNLDDIRELDIECVSKKRDPWAKLHYEAMEICQEAWGQEVGVSVSLPGPYTAAASLYSIDRLLRATRREPEKVHELLRYATDAVKIIIQEFTNTGADIFLCDPIASASIISPGTYREFVLPYTKELGESIHAAEVAFGYHICGDTTAITADMAESGCDFLSVDNKVDLKTAKEVAGSTKPLIGNVDPVDVMMLGDEEDVYQAVRECLKKAWNSPCGFIVSTGCDIPINAPIENIDYFMSAVRNCAKYPLDPLKW